MRKIVFLLLFIPSLSNALNISSMWVSDGGDKIAREYFYPHGATSSTTTISSTWDGHTVSIFAARGETAHFMPVIVMNSGSSATNVTVAMSSMTCDNGSTIVSVPVSSANVTDTTTRPIQDFSAWDAVVSSGMSSFPYGRDEYEERQYPEDLRVPCTVIAGHCVPNGGTDTWANRPFHDKHIPTALVPEEEYLISSQTFKTGTSHTFWTDIYVAPTISSTVCHGAYRVYEGATLSTSAPVELTIYGFAMPDSPHLMEIADVGNDDTTGRLQGTRGVSQPLTGNNLAAVTHIAQLLKAHNVIAIGDNSDSLTQNFPSVEYRRYLDGTAFSSANGYGNARGVGIPSNFYMIGTYSAGSNWNNSNWSQANATTFSTTASSYAFNINQINPNAKVGLYGDDEAASQTRNEKFATWLSTNTSWTTSTHINMFVTDDLVHAHTNAPHANYPASTNVFGNGASNSSTTWQTDASAYQVGPDSAVWRYNGGAIGQGGVFPYEEEPYVVEANYWGYFKKLCPNGVCSGGHFDYEANYWRNSDNPGGCGNASGDLDLYNISCTFGYDAGADTVFGRSGFNWSQGDGVLILPGKDSVYANPSFGFNGAIATFALKSIRQGVDDADILTAAYAANPSSTTALVAEMYPQALWEVTCQDPADCTYSYGERSWSYGPNNWVNARKRALILATSGLSPTTPPSQKVFTGSWTLRGGGTFH